MKSREYEDVKKEIEQLAASGYQEIVLTGIHLSSYGVDLAGKKCFTQLNGRYLLKLIADLSEIERIKRIRLGSLEPRIITEDFVKQLSEMKKVCPHFHLSLQSGCDGTLKRMNRHYTTDEYLQKTRILRRYYTDPALTTDIIVGFPQETQEEFLQTVMFLKKIAFSQMHIFKYSRRKGTAADNMKDQVPESVKVKRSDILRKLEKELRDHYRTNRLGTKQLVLMEERVTIDGQSYFAGYNEHYVKIAVKTTQEESDTDYTNQMLSVIPDNLLNNDYIS